MATYRLPVNLVYPNGGGPGVNIWHLRGGTAQPSDIDAMVNSLHTFYNTIATTGVGGAGILQNGLQISADTAVDVDTQETHAVTFASITAPGSATSLPPANQLCVSWRTSVAARRGMGRTFIGPLGANAQEANGTPAAAALDVVRGAAEQLVSDSLTDANGAIVVYGYQSQGGPLRVARDITSSSVRDVFAVLRSRRD